MCSFLARARAGKKISLGGKSIAGFKSFEVRIQYNKDVLIHPPTHSKYIYSIIIKSHKHTRDENCMYIFCGMFFCN